MLRKIKLEDFVGKTIKDLDLSAVNMVGFLFEDGSKNDLYAEDAIHTAAGKIPGIFIDEPNVEKN